MGRLVLILLVIVSTTGTALYVGAEPVSVWLLDGMFYTGVLSLVICTVIFLARTARASTRHLQNHPPGEPDSTHGPRE